MRNQLNELVELATDLRNLLAEHSTILESPIVVSDNIKVHITSGVDYMNFSFSRFPNKLEISVYDTDNFKQTSINIDIIRISDEDLDGILLCSKEEIAIFKKLFEQQIVAKRRMKILELQAELDSLFVDYNVHTV
jgi:hypothetical protein